MNTHAIIFNKYILNFKHCNSYNFKSILSCYLHSSSCFNKTKQNLEFGLNKGERRQLRKRLNLVHETLSQKKHIYKKGSQFVNKWELGKYLKSTELFSDYGLIALNKPYGISRYKYEKEDDNDNKTKSHNITQTLNTSGCVKSWLSIEETLPILNNLYNEKNLHILFCPDRWMTGILLLGASEKISEKVKKSFKRSSANRIPHLCHWVVTSGITDPLNTCERVGTTLQYVSGYNKVAVIKKDFSKKAVTRGDVKPNVVDHKVLVAREENDAALVEINILNRKWNFLRVWMAHCYSPILGDLLYSGRVRTIMGKKMVLQPHQLNAYQPPDISRKLLSKIDLDITQSEMIPLHCHLTKLRLDTFTSKSEHLDIMSEPPDYFLWTCKRLGIMDDKGNLQSPIDDHEIDMDMDHPVENVVGCEELIEKNVFR